MSTKKHSEHPHLSGEHRWGDTLQLVLLFIFLAIWVTDSFVFHYSTFLREYVPEYLRIGLSGIILVSAWLLARKGMRAVFGTERSGPELIHEGVFKWIRHPIYTGAMLFYLGASLITLSLASVLFVLPVLGVYTYIARYEEKILTEEFGQEYRQYMERTGMFFPRIFSSGSRH